LLAKPEQEPVAWRNAAIRLGEELSSVGPDRYYDMTAGQWLDWALAQEPRGKNSLPAPPKREWVGLTDEEISNCWINFVASGTFTKRNVYEAIEAKLKERNT
jgi:hypothetical protein